MFFLQKLLEQSMRMEKSRKLAIRIAGKLLGILPVFYSEYLEKRLTSGKWHPAENWRKARPCIKRGSRRKKRLCIKRRYRRKRAIVHKKRKQKKKGDRS